MDTKPGEIVLKDASRRPYREVAHVGSLKEAAEIAEALIMYSRPAAEAPKRIAVYKMQYAPHTQAGIKEKKLREYTADSILLERAKREERLKNLADKTKANPPEKWIYAYMDWKKGYREWVNSATSAPASPEVHRRLNQRI